VTREGAAPSLVTHTSSSMVLWVSK
jgi:hypothetical protein